MKTLNKIEDFLAEVKKEEEESWFFFVCGELILICTQRAGMNLDYWGFSYFLWFFSCVGIFFLVISIQEKLSVFFSSYFPLYLVLLLCWN